jgi:Zn-dependent peptidase ImmA (M78 family)/DNA-binding XRE family transcriptional regulator
MNAPLNARLVVLARQARGISQEGLAQRAGINQGFLSKIENGLKEPSEDVVKKIAEVLKFPSTFFYQPDEIYGLPVSVHALHRKKSSVGMKGLDTIHAELNIMLMNIRRLLQSVELSPRSVLPHFDVDEYGHDIERIADLTRKSWLLPRGPIENLTRSIERAGCLVIWSDFHNFSIDGITLSIHNLPVCVFLNRNRTADRMRFTLAHEIGHMVMHRYPTPDMEEQADKFASALLMPSQDMAESLKPFGNKFTLESLAYLKPIWRVSMQAILMRAKTLGIINKNQSEYMWKKINFSRIRFHEPPELDFPHEEPTLLPSVFKLHVEKLGYSMSEIAQSLNLSEAELRHKYLLDTKQVNGKNIFVLS